MNETARLLIKNGKFKEALLILLKCEEMLEVIMKKNIIKLF